MDFYNLFLKYASDLEAPTIFNKCAALICTASILNRRCWYPSGYNGIHPCLYIFFVGPIGVGKDQAARLAADQILHQVFKDCLGADVQSKERLYQVMAKKMLAVEYCDEIIHYCPATIFSSELESMTATQEDFFSALIDLWDKGTFIHSTVKHAEIVVERPGINFIANTNPNSYSDFLKSGKLGQGLARRCIFAYATKRSRIITEYDDFDAEHKRKQVLELRAKAMAFRKYIGKFSRSQEFYHAWDRDNHEHIANVENNKYANEHLQGYFNNRKVIACKVAMSFCAIREVGDIVDLDAVENFEPKMHLEHEDFLRTDEFLKETEASLQELYQVASRNPDKKYESMVKRWLRDGALTKQDIIRRLGDELDIVAVMKVLAALEEKGDIDVLEEQLISLSKK